MNSALIVLDGVLRAPSGAAIAAGVELYRTLMTQYDIVLLTDGPEVDSTAWLRREKLAKPPYVLHHDLDRYAQLELCHTTMALPIALFITSSPLEVAQGLRLGLTTMCFTHPLFSREEFRPDWPGRRKPWAEMVGEIEHQARLAEDVGVVG